MPETTCESPNHPRAWPHDCTVIDYYQHRARLYVAEKAERRAAAPDAPWTETMNGGQRQWE